MSVQATTRTVGQREAARASGHRRRTRTLAWGLVLPALALLLIVGLAPTLYVLLLAFSRYQAGGSLLQLDFVGLDNFARALRADRFWSGLWITGCFVFGSVGAQLLLGFVVALAFQRVHPLLQRVGMTFALVPMMIVPAVVGLIWKLIFNETYGPLNYLLGAVGLPEPRWGSDPQAALAGLLIADIWEWTPFVSILLLAGLQSLSQEIHEAAYVDGASPWAAFVHITLPLMKPFIFLAVFLRMIDAWKAFDLIATMTQGGPGSATESIAFYTWKVGFGVSADRGLAAALSLIQLAVIIVLGKVLLSQLQRVSRM
ncbi:MAG TPA: sugar ABC transporter permease [Roseiflexaceae bacterium]|nr:sugar ABC transporter permease [Roseiflexaceae bacterium]